MPRRFQFSLKTLAWLMLCVACFFAGMATNERLATLRQVEQKAQEQADMVLLNQWLNERQLIKDQMREAAPEAPELLEPQRSSAIDE